MDKRKHTTGIDQDNQEDTYLTNASRNVLPKEEGESFMNIASVAEDEDTQVDGSLAPVWSTDFFDTDKDADLNLLGANEFIPNPGFNQTSVLNPDKLFSNDAQREGEEAYLTNVNETSAPGDDEFAKDVAPSDFDDDGDQELVLLQEKGVTPSDLDDDGNPVLLPDTDMSNPDIAPKALIYENELDNDPCRLDVKIEGSTSDQDTFRTKERTLEDDRSPVQEAVSESSQVSQIPGIAPFGLGDVSEMDSLMDEWALIGEQIRTDPEPDQVRRIKKDAGLFTATEEILEKPEIEAFAAPNPFTGKTTIYFSNNLHQNHLTLMLTDPAGETIHSWLSDGRELEINMGHLPSGIYALKIFLENKLIDVLKLSLIP